MMILRLTRFGFLQKKNKNGSAGVCLVFWKGW